MSQSQFEHDIQEFFAHCRDKFDSRGKKYNSEETEIKDYHIFGIRSVFQHVWGKALRLKTQMLSQPQLVAFQTTDSEGPGIMNDLVDLVVYAAIFYAENRRQLKVLYQEKMLEELDAQPQPAIRFATVNNPGSTDPAVERVVLDPGQGQSSRGASGSDHEFNPVHEACPACADVLKGARPDTGDGPHDMGDIQHPEGTPGTDGSYSEGGVLLRDDEGGGQKPVR